MREIRSTYLRPGKLPTKRKRGRLKRRWEQTTTEYLKKKKQGVKSGIRFSWACRGGTV